MATVAFLAALAASAISTGTAFAQVQSKAQRIAGRDEGLGARVEVFRRQCRTVAARRDSRDVTAPVFACPAAPRTPCVVNPDSLKVNADSHMGR